MKSNIIYLNFPKQVNKLAGFPFGKEEYEKQVKGKIIIGEKTKIIFPNSIERVASSFVQGFFSDLIENIGYLQLKNDIIIETKSEELTNEILEKLF